MQPEFVVVPVVFGFLAWLVWMLFSTIRRYKIAKLQAEVQNRLLDKVGSGQELLANAQTDAGRKLLESLRVEGVSAHARIIVALQTAIVMISAGAAFLMLRNRIEDAQQGFLVLGTLLTTLGIGFAISSAASYYLSKSFGLLNGKQV